VQEGNILNRTPDYNFLNQVIDNIKNFEKKDMMMIVKEIYDATYFKYSMLFYKAEGERDRMRDVVIQKTEKIDKLQGLCASLLDVIENGKKVSTEDLLTLRQMYEDNKEDDSFTTRTPSKIIS
jgi:hypothetical protein